MNNFALIETSISYFASWTAVIYLFFFASWIAMRTAPGAAPPSMCAARDTCCTSSKHLVVSKALRIAAIGPSHQGAQTVAVQRILSY